MMDHSHQTDLAAQKVEFPATRWSLILAAKDGDHSKTKNVLEWVCEKYWHPLYVYVRRKGFSPEEAQDLTQSFFARLIEKNSVKIADQARGKFRSFLLTSFNHFLADEWDRRSAQKRGGGQASIDFDQAELLYQNGLSSDVTPERIFEKVWAQTLIEETLSHLQRKWVAKNQSVLFERLKKS